MLVVVLVVVLVLVLDRKGKDVAKQRRRRNLPPFERPRSWKWPVL